MVQDRVKVLKLHHVGTVIASVESSVPAVDHFYTRALSFLPPQRFIDLAGKVIRVVMSGDTYVFSLLWFGGR